MTAGPLPSSEPEAAPTTTATDHFYASAIPRMLRFVIVFGAALTAAAAWQFGKVVAFGFGTGALVSYWSFRSLYKAVEALAARIVESHRPERGFSLMSGFFLRYLFAGIVAYVIFTSSSRAFRGFLFGLCTPVAALLTEAAFEAYSALRRGH